MTQKRPQKSRNDDKWSLIKIGHLLSMSQLIVTSIWTLKVVAVTVWRARLNYCSNDRVEKTFNASTQLYPEVAHDKSPNTRNYFLERFEALGAHYWQVRRTMRHFLLTYYTSCIGAQWNIWWCGPDWDQHFQPCTKFPAKMLNLLWKFCGNLFVIMAFQLVLSQMVRVQNNQY